MLHGGWPEPPQSVPLDLRSWLDVQLATEPQASWQHVLTASAEVLPLMLVLPLMRALPTPQRKGEGLGSTLGPLVSRHVAPTP